MVECLDINGVVSATVESPVTVGNNAETVELQLDIELTPANITIPVVIEPGS